MDPHEYSVLLYLAPIVAAWLVTLGLAGLAYRRRGVAGALPFALTMGLEAEWIGGYILELLSPSLAGKIFWENAQYVGTLLAPLVLLMFAWAYCDRQPALGWKLWAGLALPALVVLGLAFTNPWHQLAIHNQRLIPGNPFDYYAYDFGVPVYAVLFYNYGLMLWAIYWLARQYARQHGLARRQTGFILAGTLIPVLGSVTIFFNIPFFPQRDISPYYFAVSDLFMAYGLFHYRLFDIVAFARDLVMENMEDGVVVVDPLGHLLDLNPAATRMLDLAGEKTAGRPRAARLPAWLEQIQLDQATASIRQAVARDQSGAERTLDVRATRLLNRSGWGAGHMLILRDVTERQRAEDALRQLNAELEDRVRERTAELTRVNADLTGEIHERQQAERRSAAFSALGLQLSAATTPPTAAEVIVATADQLLGWDTCFLDLFRAEADVVQTILAIDNVDGQRTRINLGAAYKTPPPILRQVLTAGAQLLLTDDPASAWPDIETHGAGAQQPASLLFAPIRHGAQAIGCLSIQSYTPNAYDQAALETLQALADHCGGALERIQSEERIRDSLRDKEVLLKEIHHRVKNNLQVISSLLSLQSRQVSDARTLEMLRDSQNRIRSMALVHERLYRSADLAHFDFADYIRALATQLLRTYGQHAQVGLTVQAAPCELDVERAVACGLILNELISNALKHAFPGERAGEIRISLERADLGGLRLQVGDDGVGWPAGLDFRQSPSLGLQLVNTLVDQIGGTLTLTPGPGTTFQIEFAAPPANLKSERP